MQCGMKAPKDQYNSFGKYAYRTCAAILEAAKPFLDRLACHIEITTDVEEHLNMTYFKATAKLVDNETGEFIEAHSYAREMMDAKGMSDPQMSGSTETYCKKYALGNLLLIDDSELDPDTEKMSEAAKAPSRKPTQKPGRTKEEEEALAYKYNGITLGDIYKQDRQLFYQIAKEGTKEEQTHCAHIVALIKKTEAHK